MSDQNAFDVILTTHNRLELTIECLQTLYQNTPLPFHLIIIDDSTDLTPKFIESFKKDNISYVFHPALKGGNHCLQVGLEHVKTDCVVCLNNSSRVESDWVISPLQVLKENPRVGLVGIKLLYPNGLIWHAGIGFNNSLPFHVGINESGHRYSHIRIVPCVNYSVGFFRKQALENALDTDTYIGWRSFEDTDVCVTLRRNGWQIAYCGLSSAYHIESPTRLEGDQQKFWQEYNENMRRFLSKWQGTSWLQ